MILVCIHSLKLHRELVVGVATGWNRVDTSKSRSMVSGNKRESSEVSIANERVREPEVVSERVWNISI